MGEADKRRRHAEAQRRYREKYPQRVAAGIERAREKSAARERAAMEVAFPWTKDLLTAGELFPDLEPSDEDTGAAEAALAVYEETGEWPPGYNPLGEDEDE